MWLACYTQEEIVERVGLTQGAVGKAMELSELLQALPKVLKLSAAYGEPGWTPQKTTGSHTFRRWGRET